MNKTKIIIDKSMPIGVTANISAIIMGQLSLIDTMLYDSQPILDRDNNNHCAIKLNIIILKAGTNQIHLLVEELMNYRNTVKYILFSETGKNFSNSFEQYKYLIQQLPTNQTKIIGIGISGEAEIINSLTKKFSLL